MHELEKLKYMLVDVLAEAADGDRVSKNDIPLIKTTASAADHICNIIKSEYGMSYGDESYGSYGENSYEGEVYNDYGDGGSYARRGGRGYSRDGMSGERSFRRGSDARGRYTSRDGLTDKLRELAQNAPSDKKEEFEKFIAKMEQM